MSNASFTSNDSPSDTITPAQISWQADDFGNQVPVSEKFGDVYFSHADGLAESRYVFLNANQLPERLTALSPKQSFIIAELGFGTGLNLLAVWQLWRQLRADHPHLATARLQFITTEKHPIALSDLTQILALWRTRAPELAEVIDKLLTHYPPLIKGCHRLNFYEDNLYVDIWLGDAAESLVVLDTDSHAHIDAWFLDGFAPSCNHSLWADSIFGQMQRISTIGTTAATYSCAGIAKRGLTNIGFDIQKIKGFGRKREMLTAVMTADAMINHEPNSADNTKTNIAHTVVVGAGISGLMSAWSLANRGINVTLLDKTAPLAGASGNPRALLAPKMTPIHHAYEHLHTIGYLYSSRFYRTLNTQAQVQNVAPILEPTGALDLLIKANIDVTQIKDYPDAMATTLSDAQAKKTSGLQAQDLSANLYLPQSGLINPRALKDVILNHPRITFKRFNVTEIIENDIQVTVNSHDENHHKTSITADNVVICAAYESHALDSRIFDCRKIRGQLSWFTPSPEQQAKLPKLPLKYSGYCTLFTAQTGDDTVNNVAVDQPQFLLGASFVRNETATDIRDDEHHISRDKLVTAIPELADVIPTDTSKWQGRAGVRTQTPDYHPMLGRLDGSCHIWTLSAMGAKGYAFAPICAESLADMMTGSFAPLSMQMLDKLSPNRTRLQTALDS